MELRKIQKLVRKGAFTIKPHSLPHRLKEGFSVEDMIYAILKGRIIEEYPERHRVLIYAEVPMLTKTTLPLHVVCDYSDPEWIDLVTAYISDPAEWLIPPTKRRRR